MQSTFQSPTPQINHTGREYIPKWYEILEAFPEICKLERARVDKPGRARELNVIAATKYFLKSGLVNEKDSVNTLTGKILRQWMDKMILNGMKPLSAHSYIQGIRTLFGRWIRTYYEDRGWCVPQFPTIPSIKRDYRYHAPSQAKIQKLKEWYVSLDNTTPKWMVVTMMLCYAMRNGDVSRLTRDNFVIGEDGRMYLEYTPHKTMHSSARVVHWPLQEGHWELFDKILPETGDLNQIIHYKAATYLDIFTEVNKDMRALGFTGSKGAYELRKIATNSMYKKYGVEMAVSLSGDDIKTILKHYADPSQPHVNISMIDLL